MLARWVTNPYQVHVLCGTALDVCATCKMCSAAPEMFYCVLLMDILEHKRAYLKLNVSSSEVDQLYCCG